MKECIMLNKRRLIKVQFAVSFKTFWITFAKKHKVFLPL